LNEQARKTLAKWLLLASLIASALAAGMIFVAVVSCLVHCQRGLSPHRVVALVLLAIAVLSIISCALNFLVSVWKHGWKGLNGWEKAAAYVAAAAALTPVLADATFNLVRVFD
jgi:hypothetical protein